MDRNDDNDLTISIDPGVVNLGLVIFGDNDRIVGMDTINLRAWSEKEILKGDNPDAGAIGRAISNFIENSIWAYYFFIPKVRIIIESNTIKCTLFVPGILIGKIISVNPSAQIYTVEPMFVAGFFKVRGTRKLNRNEKKKLTLKRMREYFDPQSYYEFESFDIADAMQNFLYAKLRFFSKPPLKNPFTKESDAIPNGEIDTTVANGECEWEPEWPEEIEVDQLPS